MNPSIGITPGFGIDAVHSDRVQAKCCALALIVLILLAWTASFVVGFPAALMVLALTALGAAVVGVRWPAVGLIGIAMSCALEPMSRGILAEMSFWRFNTLTYWLCVVMLLSGPFLLRLDDLHTRLWQLFVLLLGLGLAVSPQPAAGAQQFLNVVVLFGLLVYFARTGSDGGVLYWTALVTGILSAVGSPAYFLQQDQLPPITHCIWVYFPLTALFSTCLAFPFVGDRRGQFVLMSLAIVNCIWTFLSGSRGGLAVAVCCILFLMIKMRDASSRVLIVTTAVLLGVVASFFFADLHESALDRVTILLSDSEADRDKYHGRSDLVIAGWNMFLDNPFGVGTGGFASAWLSRGRIGGMTDYGQGIEKSAHATWIQVLAENGIPGILLLGGFVAAFAFVGWRRADANVRGLALLTTVVLGVALCATEFHKSIGLCFLAAGVMSMLYREKMAVHLRSALAPSR